MNFFHRIFAKEKNSARANNGPFFEQLEFRKSDWLDVFSVCLGKMYVIQSAVGKTVIGDSDWEVVILNMASSLSASGSFLHS